MAVIPRSFFEKEIFERLPFDGEMRDVESVLDEQAVHRAGAGFAEFEQNAVRPVLDAARR